MLKLGTSARGHFVTLIEILVHQGCMDGAVGFDCDSAS